METSTDGDGDSVSAPPKPEHPTAADAVRPSESEVVEVAAHRMRKRRRAESMDTEVAPAGNVSEIAGPAVKSSSSSETAGGRNDRTKKATLEQAVKWINGSTVEMPDEATSASLLKRIRQYRHGKMPRDEIGDILKSDSDLVNAIGLFNAMHRAENLSSDCAKFGSTLTHWDCPTYSKIERRPQVCTVGQSSIGKLSRTLLGTANVTMLLGAGNQQNLDITNLGSRTSSSSGDLTSYSSAALFGGLQTLASCSTDDDAAVTYRQSRASSQPVSTLPTMPTTYLPHASIGQPELKIALIKIAAVCQFLDAAFAEYFRVAISHGLVSTTRLSNIRERICSRQPDAVEYIGPLGEYCERINITLEKDRQARTEDYRARATGDEILPYLQDALEVPYWDMMADEFIKSSHINSQFTYDAVLSVINDKRRELKLRLQQVKMVWRDALPKEVEDGIARRIGVLDVLLAQTSDKYDSLEEQRVQALQRSPTSKLGSASLLPDATTSEPASLTAKISSANDISDLEKVSPLSLLFIFTALAMVPFGMGFAGNWSAKPSDAVGSTSDPDFKWLISTTLLAVFGNIYAVVPLRKITRGSTANVISQVFLYVSIILGIFSVSVYPFWNKAWSASLSFFCSFFAIGSVFISAQHTSDTAPGGSADALKVKKNQ